MSKTKIVGSAVLGIIILACVVALSMGAEILGIKWRGVTEPMRADVQRKAFEKTRSFNQAVLQDLAEYKRQHDMAGNEQDKNTIRLVVQQRFAEYDATKLPDGLRVFLESSRGY